jgi:hypothetical protein
MSDSCEESDPRRAALYFIQPFMWSWVERHAKTCPRKDHTSYVHTTCPTHLRVVRTPEELLSPATTIAQQGRRRSVASTAAPSPKTNSDLQLVAQISDVFSVGTMATPEHASVCLPCRYCMLLLAPRSFACIIAATSSYQNDGVRCRFDNGCDRWSSRVR